MNAEDDEVERLLMQSLRTIKKPAPEKKEGDNGKQHDFKFRYDDQGILRIFDKNGNRVGRMWEMDGEKHK